MKPPPLAKEQSNQPESVDKIAEDNSSIEFRDIPGKMVLIVMVLNYFNR